MAFDMDLQGPTGKGGGDRTIAQGEGEIRPKLKRQQSARGFQRHLMSSVSK